MKNLPLYFFCLLWYIYGGKTKNLGGCYPLTTLKKIYIQPDWILFRGMRDAMDTQNSRQLSGAENKTEIRFAVRMYEIIWTLRFTAVTIEGNSCEAALKVIKAEPADEPEDELNALAGFVLRREFALLDAMLIIGTPCEVTYIEEEEVT